MTQAQTSAAEDIRDIEKDILWEYVVQEALSSPAVLSELIFRDEEGKLITQSKVHLDLFEFIKNNQEGVIELPRECGKTVNMIALAAWVIGLNPDVRIKIVANADSVANARVKALKEVIETDTYQRIFPHIKPGREWSDERFTVKRNTLTPEATCEGYGVLSKATGGRCDWLLLDDVDDEEVVVSDVKRNRNKERVANVWLNLLTPAGRAFAFATPWHESDTVHMLKRNGWPSFRRPVLNMTPVWPERWDRHTLEEKRRKVGSLAFARGWELVCINSETAPIKGQWFKYWKQVPRLTNIGIVCDPNNSLKDSADYTAIGTLGVTYDYKVYLLELDRAHYEFPSLITAITKAAQLAEERYKLTPTIGIEDTAYQKAIPQQLKIETKYPIYALRADKSKFIRASRLAVHIENGRVHLKGDGNGGVHPEQAILYDECTAFPSSQHVDCVDMLGYGVEMMLQYARRTGAAFG